MIIMVLKNMIIIRLSLISTLLVIIISKIGERVKINKDMMKMNNNQLFKSMIIRIKI